MINNIYPVMPCQGNSENLLEVIKLLVKSSRHDINVKTKINSILYKKLSYRRETARQLCMAT